MAFVPRLSEHTPTEMRNPDNPWWYSSGNIYYGNPPHTYGLPNCTCYAYGRAGEINGAFVTDLPMANGGDWLNRVVSAGVLPTGTTPQLGAIMVFRDRPDATVHNDGHVAVVEQINADGSVVTSNSGWQSLYFWTETLRPENGYISSWMHDSNHDYYYQGCIYIYNYVPPVPTRRRKLPIWMLLRYAS